MAATPEFQHVSFRAQEAAQRNLARIAELSSSAIIDGLMPVLGGVADPDLALILFVRLLEQHRTLERTFAQNPTLIYYAATVFGHSQWLGETLVQSPELLTGFVRDKSLGRTLSPDEYAERLARYRARSTSEDGPALLARFKRREYVRIMLRDVLGIATLSEVTAELSALADGMIEEAVRLCDQDLRNRYGAPQVVDSSGRLVEAPFAVLALGKLGGNELNYSSDLDLLYIYGTGETPDGAPITNREYFVRLAQEITATLSQTTGDGAPFRIDLRLRPQGSEGELASSLDHAIDYYTCRAADWELQALIKVRHAAGDQKLAREFIARVQPLVYVEQLNLAAIETAVRSGERIQSRRRRAAARSLKPVDVKLDRGGIRDIEFLVQCLQRVYGGSEPWLRSRGTMFSLQKLHDKAHISSRDFHELTAAYEFLRTLEHRLQLRLGQQVHELPSEAPRLACLARGLSPRLLAQGTADALKTTLDDHMARVQLIYERVIHQQQVAERVEHGPEFKLRADIFPARDASQYDILERLAHDAPHLHRLARQEFAPHTRSNVFRFLSAAFTFGERYRLLLENQEAFESALEIFAVSDFLTDLLVRYPEEVASIAGMNRAVGTEGDRLLEFSPDRRDRSAFVDFIARSDAPAAERLTLIRRHHRSRVFVAGARDILQRRNVFDSLSESTAIALESISAALALRPWPEELAVFALGRLGTGEFDALSDADLVFVRDQHLDSAIASSAAVHLMQSLSAYTRDGSLFPVDARLRPHGNAGELVVTPAELARYFESDAQPWEALTWTKLRCICGPESIRAEVFSAAERLFRRHATKPDFAASLRAMRDRLEKSEEPDSIRTGAGAVYDLDYIAGFQLVRSHETPRFGGNLRQRFEALREAKALSGADASTLAGAAQVFRTVDHAIRLATGSARPTPPRAGHARDAVDTLVRACLPDITGDLDSVLSTARANVRATFQSIFSVTAM